MATINGTPNADTLGGTIGNDTIDGAGGDDFIGGKAGDDLITGGDGNDYILGDDSKESATDGNDALYGGNGHDFLRGGGGNDKLYGEAGDDSLSGGSGNDILDGGAGYDRAVFGFGSVTGVHVDLNYQGIAQDTGQGLDTLTGIENVTGTGFTDVLVGDGGDNWLYGITGNDVVSGGGGDDLIEVGFGNGTFDGGAGFDTISFFGDPSAINAGVTIFMDEQGIAQGTGQGSMTLNGFESVSGSVFADHITGDAGDNVLLGDSGDDVLTGGRGNDILYGDGRTLVDDHNSGSGSGPITRFADVAPLGGADGNDLLEGGLGDDTLYGGGGIDTASYANASGDVEVYLNFGFAQGADGNDTLSSIENVIGSNYNDILFGDAGANSLTGGAGHDFLRGNAGDDTLSGGAGDDMLVGGAGNDVLDGGAGWDRAAFSGSTVGVHVDLNVQGAQYTGEGTDTLVGIEHVSGTAFDDTLIGTIGPNWLWGMGGNDIIQAGGGNDLVQLGAGNSAADGGAGTDSLSMEGVGAATSTGVTLSLLLQGGAQDSGAGLVKLSGFENLSGSDFGDSLTGDGGANVLAGDAGGDILSGGDGDDVLLGDGRIGIDSHGLDTSGPITFFNDVAALGGADGDDVLDGGKGNDTLMGGGGDDLLTGGGGSDRFVFGSHTGHDHILDFGAGDAIVFQPTSGVHSAADLTLTATGSGTLISWASGDSILVDGTQPQQLLAGAFVFDGAAPPSDHAIHTSLAPSLIMVSHEIHIA